MMRWLEAALWLVGITCTATYAVATAQTAHVQGSAIAEMEAEWHVEANAQPDQSLWSEERVDHYRPAQAVAERLSPHALLTIPKIDVRVAVFNGTSDRVLNLGAGRVPGTATVSGDGNLAIAAHRDGFFRGLKDIELGDEIAVQHRDGINRYTVTEVSIVEPSDVSVLAQTETPTLTLITCYPFYFVGSAPQRFIVRAKLGPFEENF